MNTPTTLVPHYIAGEWLRSTQLAAAPGFELELDNVQLSAAEQLRLDLREATSEAKRKKLVKRLKMIEAFWLTADTGEAYKQFCVGQGQREGQFKTVAIAYRKNFAFDLDARVEQGE